MPRQKITLPLSLPADPSKRRLCRACIEERLAARRGIHGVRVILTTEEPCCSAEGHEKSDRACWRAEEGVTVETQTQSGAATALAEAPPTEVVGEIELDYDPEVIGLEQINGYLRQAGGCLSPSIAHIVLPVEGLVSPSHEQNVQAMLSRLPGVRAAANYSSQSVRVEFDRRQCALPEIVRRLEKLGVEITTPATHAQPVIAGASSGIAGVAAPGATQQRRTLPGWLHEGLSQTDLIVALLAGVFLLAGAGVHGLMHLGYVSSSWDWVRVSLLLVSYVLGGWFPAQDSFQTLRQFKIDIDFLMFAAAFGAAALGHFEEGAMLLFLFSLGGAGERLAMSRARSAISALAKLAPKTARRIRPDGTHHEVKVEDLAVGDAVLVRPGELVPADGAVTHGNSAVNQAPITGESVPVDKKPGDDVFAGTINGDGVLSVRVTKRSQDNTLSKVIRLVSEAQTTKSPTQMFTDRVEKFYVPLVLVATVAVIVLPVLMGWQSRQADMSNWKGWFYQAMAFLTAASPCALAIGTPAAVLSGIGRAARAGVLVKGGVHLESLGRVRAVAFDKTGTLTRGHAEVTDLVTLDPTLGEPQLLALAAAIERTTTHPLAQAIVREADHKEIENLSAHNVEQTPGTGIRGDVSGRRISVGRLTLSPESAPRYAQALSKMRSLQEQGKTVVAVADESGVLGLIALMDQPRKGVRQMLVALKALGIQHTIMLTGDNHTTARAVAAEVGVDECLAELLPEDKLQQIKALDKKYGRVAMVGDGVNDAPALASATVGIAIGGASGGGSDVALETADVALLADDMNKLPEAIGISRYARTIIIQNLVIALGVIAVVAPLSALGYTAISAAVLLHEGSTVVVVLNSLRILAYRPPVVNRV